MNNNDFRVLAQTVYGEARGEPFLAKLAVAHVVMNRWRSGKWFAAKTIAGTAKKKWQFSSWNPGDPNREKMEVSSMKDSVYRECAYAALGAMTGRLEDPTMGATHFHTTDVHPNWAIGHTSHCTIGRHRFYIGIL